MEILRGERKIESISSLSDYIRQFNPNYSPKRIGDKDRLILEELLLLLESKKEFYYHNLAKTMNEMFGAAHRPRNRFLKMFDLETIGNSTKL